MPFNEYYYIFVVSAFLPMAWIFRHAGFKPYWALLLLIPDAGLIFCAVLLALRKWPRGKEA